MGASVYGHCSCALHAAYRACCAVGFRATSSTGQWTFGQLKNWIGHDFSCGFSAISHAERRRQRLQERRHAALLSQGSRHNRSEDQMADLWSPCLLRPGNLVAVWINHQNRRLHRAAGFAESPDRRGSGHRAARPKEVRFCYGNHQPERALDGYDRAIEFQSAGKLAEAHCQSWR